MPSKSFELTSFLAASRARPISRTSRGDLAFSLDVSTFEAFGL